MGRRALQPRSPKQGAKSSPSRSCPSPPPPPPPTSLPPNDEPSCSLSPFHNELDDQASTKSAPPVPHSSVSMTPSPNKGLDRVVLERNLERLLTEQNNVTPEMEKLLNSHDRCRDPLDLTQLNLSLDDWQVNTVQMEAPEHSSSMPDLGPADGSARRPRDKAQLSVRFEGEGSGGPSQEDRKSSRSRYSGRQGKHEDPPRSRKSDPENEDYCSTCSSSSSDDDDVYELPPRRAYGGVRISYVPNDALAVARRQQAAFRSPTKSNPNQDKNCIIS